MARSDGLRVAHLTDVHFCSSSEVVRDFVLRLGALVGAGYALKLLVDRLPPRERAIAWGALGLGAVLAARFSPRVRRVLLAAYEILWLSGMVDRERLESVMKAVRRHRVDHLLISGDLVTTSRAGEFEEAKDFFARHGWEGERLTVVAGNHDRFSVDDEESPEHHFGRPEVFRELAPGIGLACLDSTRKPGNERDIVDAIFVNTGGSVDRRQVSELERKADGFDGTMLVALHHPTWETKTFTAASGLVPSRIKKDFWGPVENHELVTGFLDGRRAAVVCGHVHPESPLVKMQGGARLLCSPASALRSKRAPGFGLFHLRPGKPVGYEWMEV